MVAPADWSSQTTIPLRAAVNSTKVSIHPTPICQKESMQHKLPRFNASPFGEVRPAFSSNCKHDSCALRPRLQAAEISLRSSQYPCLQYLYSTFAEQL